MYLWTRERCFCVKGQEPQEEMPGKSKQSRQESLLAVTLDHNVTLASTREYPNWEGEGRPGRSGLAPAPSTSAPSTSAPSTSAPSTPAYVILLFIMLP